MNVEVKTRSGQVFYVETDPALAGGDDERAAERDNLGPAGGQPMGRGVLDRTESMFGRAIDVVRNVSEDVTTGLLETDKPPSEVSLSLNLGFDAGGSVWILKGGAKASLQLTLRWRLPRTREHHEDR